MADTTHPQSWAGVKDREREKTAPNAGRQAYQLLHTAFVIAPLIAGLDKFTNMLVDWTHYLARPILNLSPVSAMNLMRIIGGVEILAALIVAIRPRIGAYVVAAWLGAIIVNLLVAGSFFDIALRDLGLMLSALALARLSKVYGTT